MDSKSLLRVDSDIVFLSQLQTEKHPEYCTQCGNVLVFKKIVPHSDRDTQFCTYDCLYEYNKNKNKNKVDKTI